MLVAVLAFNFQDLAVRFFDLANTETDSLRRRANRDVYRYLKEEMKDARLRLLLESIYAGLYQDTIVNEPGEGHVASVRLNGVLPYQFPFGYTERRLSMEERLALLARMREGQPDAELRSVPSTEETTAEWAPERQQFLKRVQRIFGTKDLSVVSKVDFENFFDHHEHWLREQHWTMEAWPDVSAEELLRFFIGDNPWKVARRVHRDRHHPIEFRVRERARFAYDELQGSLRGRRLAH